jgi:hypothetical protein
VAEARERREMRKVNREAHNKGKPNEMESVDVWGTGYRSVWTAWQALKIGGNRWKHQIFRKQLKLSKCRRLIYTDERTGEMYPFRLIPYDPKLP